MTNKEWKHKVSPREDSSSLGQILKKEGFTKKEISRQKFLPDGITVDGKRCRITELVREGQEICLKFREELEEAPEADGHLPELEVCYEDEDLLIVNKPPGVSSHPGRGHYRENLGSQAAAYCREKGEPLSIREIGRLDKDTSGLVLFAKSREAAVRLWKQREQGTLHKVYRAAVHGKIEEPEGILSFPMEKIPDEKNKMRAAPWGMRAVTHYRVLGKGCVRGKEVSLAECILETGRTHQIRVHMAHFGHPLLGDVIYGIPDEAKRLYLHAERLTLIQPFTGEAVTVEAPPGEDWDSEIKKLLTE